MAFKLFKREPVKNELDFASTIVVLPKTGKELTLEKLVNDHDAILNMHGYANGDHMVKVNDDEEMSVNDLVKKHMDMCNEMAAMKEAHEKEGAELEKAENDKDKEMEDCHNEKDEKDEEDKKKENEEKDKEEKERKENAKRAAKDVRDAEKRYLNEQRETGEQRRIELSVDQVARGRARYGSQR